VARRSGQVDDAGDVTTGALLRRGLLRRGLLRRGRHPDAPTGAAGATVLEVTAAGRVVLDQAEALRIRALDALVGVLGSRDTAVLLAAAQALSGALDVGSAEDQPAVSRKRLPAGPGGVRPVES
jgi:hypothetical protein